MLPMLARAVSVGWLRQRCVTVSLSRSFSLSAGVGCCCQPHGKAWFADDLLQLVPAVAAAGRFLLAEMHGGKTFGVGTCRDTGAGRDGVRVSVCVRACALYRSSSRRFPQPPCSYLLFFSNR